METNKTPLIEVKGLKKHYPVYGGVIPHPVAKIHAVDDVGFAIYEGETLGLVGESGCGKSTIGRQLAALEKPTNGEILYDRQKLNTFTPVKLRRIRTQIQMVFQDPYSSLNPRKTIRDILGAPLLYHGLCNRETLEKELNRLLLLVGLPENSKNRYPHEFSGGQRQRIGIARALSLNPRFIICDEPVSALDVSIQAQILNLLRSLQAELKLTYLFIGHGLDAVHYMSNRIAVMYLGKIVEIADSEELFHNPIHPYTKALYQAAPIPDPAYRERERSLLQGEIPSNRYIPAGCRFNPRCSYAREECKKAEPVLMPVATDSSHLAACPVMTELILSRKNGMTEIPDSSENAVGVPYD